MCKMIMNGFTAVYIVQAMGLGQSEHRVIIEASANEHTENAT